MQFSSDRCYNLKKWMVVQKCPNFIVSKTNFKLGALYLLKAGILNSRLEGSIRPLQTKNVVVQPH